MILRTKRSASLAALAVVLALPILALADQPVTKPPAAATHPVPEDATWLRVEAPEFTLLGQVPEARLRTIAIRLEAFRASLGSLHPGARSSPRETTVYVFKDAAGGRPYSPPLADAGRHLGVNPPYDVPNYVTVAAPVDDPPLELLYHAYAHQFLDDNYPRLPLAVTEGLAEFYSGFAIDTRGTLIGVPRMDHVRWLRDHAALPLSEQLSLGARAPLLEGQAGRATFMADSWALMHYLVSGSGEERSRLPALLGALQRGTPPGDAVLSAYGWSLDHLQEEVGAYVRRNRFPPILVGRETQEPGLEARPMEKAEIDAALGDLLAHAGAGRAAEAESRFRDALRLDPAQWRAHAGLGYLRYAEGRFADAVPSLEKAVQIEPDAMTCYLLARSLLRINAVAVGGSPAAAPVAAASPAGPPAGGGTPSWLARARTLLARAIELRPGFAAPYVTLGATHTYPDGDVAAGIELLQKARAMLPARMDIAGNLVYLLLRKGDLTQAQALVDGPLADGGDEETLQSARQALATYREHLKAKQSLAATRLTPAEQARRDEFRSAMAAQLRDALAETDDPETRARIEEQLRRFEAAPSAGVAEVYNEAVERANQRDYAGAIALLESLLPRVEDPELGDQIKKLLERFRRDAARLQQGVK